MSTRRGPAWRTGALAAVAGVLGVVVGALSVVVHRAVVDVAGWSLPWGVALAVVASVCMSVAVRGAGPWPVAAFGIGWCATVLMLLDGRAEGDYLVAGDRIGWGFLAVGSIAVVAATLRGVFAGRTRPAGADPGDGLNLRT